MDPLEKSPGATGCSHCQRLGAVDTCPLCGRPVCTDCLAPQTCPDPGVRELRLGTGARLQAVGCSGDLGVVSSWQGRCRVVDLRSGQAVIQFPLGMQNPWPRLAGAGRVVTAVISRLTSGLYSGLRLLRLSAEGTLQADPTEPIRVTETLLKALQVSTDGRHALVLRHDESVDLFDLSERCLVRNIAVGSGQVILSAASSAAMDLLALGTYGRVILFGISNGSRLGPVVVGDCSIRWTGLGCGRAAAVDERGQVFVTEVGDADHPAPAEAAALPDVRAVLPWMSLTREAAGELPQVAACLSNDGRLLAVALDRRAIPDGPSHPVLVLQLETGRRQVLGGHTDRVRLVQFVDRDRFLVTADNDARVRIWPRRGDLMVDRSC